MQKNKLKVAVEYQGMSALMDVTTTMTPAILQEALSCGRAKVAVLVPDSEQSEICPYWNDSEFREAWIGHREVRKSKKGSLSDRADNQILRKLTGITKAEAIAELDRSANAGWTSVYPKEREHKSKYQRVL
jgi:RNA polymerase subunit RPABC4/transcription elongation factor Spt4